MQFAGASTQHAGARGIDAGRGDDDAGPGGVQLESLNTDSLFGRPTFEARVRLRTSETSDSRLRRGGHAFSHRSRIT